MTTAEMLISEMAKAGPVSSAILNWQPVTEDYGIEDVTHLSKNYGRRINAHRYTSHNTPLP